MGEKLALLNLHIIILKWDIFYTNITICNVYTLRELVEDWYASLQ